MRIFTPLSQEPLHKRHTIMASERITNRQHAVTSCLDVAIIAFIIRVFVLCIAVMIGCMYDVIAQTRIIPTSSSSPSTTIATVLAFLSLEPLPQQSLFKQTQGVFSIDGRQSLYIAFSVPNALRYNERRVREPRTRGESLKITCSLLFAFSALS